jgi:hypothetical protein
LGVEGFFGAKAYRQGRAMDNLSSHKVDGVRQRIEKCGARLLYLPPYSPDLNPYASDPVLIHFRSDYREDRELARLGCRPSAWNSPVVSKKLTLNSIVR